MTGAANKFTLSVRVISPSVCYSQLRDREQPEGLLGFSSRDPYPDFRMG